MGVEVRVAVVVPVYNRAPGVLGAVLAALDTALAETEAGVVVVNDGSDEKHCAQYEDWILPALRTMPRPNLWTTISTIRDRPKAYHIGGHNNPAYAINVGIEAAMKWEPERILILSSDVLMQADAVLRALSYPLPTIVIPHVRDTSGTLFCSTQQLWPMCWFMMAGAEDVAATGYDEQYLAGMAFEDNDFTARLFLRTEVMVFDDRIQVLHQTHPPTAYSDELKGFKLNEAYTRKKWSGKVPWRTGESPFRYDVRWPEKGVALLTNPQMR